MVVRPQSENLAGWKAISAYLEVSPRTAQLWEKKFGLPVKRVGGSRGAVHATIVELDAWRLRQTESGEHTLVDDTTQPSPHDETPAEQTPAEQAPSKPEPRRPLGLYLTALLAVIALAAAAWTIRPETPYTPVEPQWSMELPTITADPEFISLSPSGDRIAFVGVEARSDWNALFTVDVATGELEPLVRQGVARAPAAWSPDGDRIAFVGTSGELYSIPSSGGERTLIAKLPANRVIGMNWREDGQALLVCLLSAGILEIDVETGQVMVLMNHPHVEDAQYVEYKGRRALLFASEDGNPEGTVSLAAPHDVSVLWLESGIVEELFTVAHTVPRVRYHPDGYVLHAAGTPDQPRVVATPIDLSHGDSTSSPIVVSEGGSAASVLPDGSVAVLRGERRRRRLAWMNRAGERVEGFGDSLFHLERPRISPAGDRAIAYGADGMEAGFWLMDAEGAHRLGPSSVRLTMSAWRKDGKIAAHEGVVDGILSICLVNVDRPEDRRSIPSYGFIPDDWSHDGKTLLGSKRVDGAWKLWMLPVDGSSVGRAAVAGPGNHWDGRFSPDGKLMSYGRIYQGERHVFVRRVDAPANDRGVIVAQGRQARWTRGGTELVYEREGVLYAVSIGLEDGRIVSDSPDQERFRLPEDTHKSMFDVAPDGEHILMARPSEEDPSPLRIDVWSQLALP